MSEGIWNREELYEKVWTKPVTKVAKEYGYSDVAIAKICRKLKVPLPGRGYWAKITNGHSVPRTPLPRLKEQIVVARSEPVAPREEEDLTASLHPEDRAEFARIDELAAKGIFSFETVKSSLRHPLILAARDALKHGDVDERKIIRPPYRSTALNIRVSKDNIDRALEFFSKVITIAGLQGGDVKVVKSEYDVRTEFVAYDHSVTIEVSETAHQKYLENPPPQIPGKYVYVRTFKGKPIEYVPTRQLTLEIGTYGKGLRRTWKENSRQTLEGLFPEIILTLLKACVLRRRDWLKEQAEAEARRRREAEWAQLRPKVQEEERRVLQLEQAAENWAKAKRIREYVLAAIEVKKQAGEELGPDTPLGIWAAWALQQADRLDPLTKSPPSILDRKKELPPEPNRSWR
jgi:hypothetical protein